MVIFYKSWFDQNLIQFTARSFQENAKFLSFKVPSALNLGPINRSFSRDVIAFKNLKLKIYQSLYPHQVKEGAYLFLFTIFQRNSLLRLETRAF